MLVTQTPRLTPATYHRAGELRAAVAAAITYAERHPQKHDEIRQFFADLATIAATRLPAEG